MVLFNQASLTTVVQVSEKFMRIYFRLALSLLACGMAGSCLSATAQVLDATLPMQYIPLEVPCRAVDTRPAGTVTGGSFRNFNPAGGGCAGLLTPGSGVIAYAVNVTVLPHGPLSYLTVWPAGEPQPGVSTLNSPDGRTKANAAIVTGGAKGEISVFAYNTTDVLLDVSGYFVSSASGVATYSFFPITPCRVVDTRYPNGQFGTPALVAKQQRSFQLDMSSCHLSRAPEEAGGALSINVTVIPRGKKPVGHVTVWGTSSKHPETPSTSTVNVPTGTMTANAAIVSVNPLSAESVSVEASEDTDIAIDVNGYFALGILPGAEGLSLYTLPPCRILDTRPNGEFQGERTVPVTTDNNCSVSGVAKAYVLNATVVPPGPLTFLTLWADGTNQPGTSTLNAEDGVTSSNMAIVETTNGSIDAFASQTTQLLLDISAYFAP
jgi:hypothetical protein